MAIRSGGQEKEFSSETVTAVDTGAAGEFTVTFSDFTSIAGVEDVNVSAVIYYDPGAGADDPTVGGFLAIPASVYGNTVTFYMLYYATAYAAAAGSLFRPITGATDIASVYANAMGMP